MLTDGEVVRYLNRLADLIFVPRPLRGGRIPPQRLTVRHVTDARGTAVELTGLRVVSLVPSLTEWLVVTGVGERLVGVTDCVPSRPARSTGGPGSGAPRTPTWRPSAALEPDLVVANAEENRKLDVQRLERGLAVFVTMPTTVAGAVGELRDLAAAVGDLPGRRPWTPTWSPPWPTPTAASRPSRVRYACPVWRDPWLWLGRRTYAADLLGLAGASGAGRPHHPLPEARPSRSWPPGPLRWCCRSPSRTSSARPTPTRRPPPSPGPGSSWPTAAPSPGTAWRIPAALAGFRELLGGRRAAST